MGAMAQADVGHGVKAVSPEGKLIKRHEIHCMATTASGTFGAPLRNKAGHQAQDDVDEQILQTWAKVAGLRSSRHKDAVDFFTM